MAKTNTTMENGLSTMDSKQVNYFVETADGSKTIYNPQVGENYHSRNGALQESEHVFLNSGLKYFLSLTPTLSSEGVLADNGARVEKVSILEVGFGTGLNFLLSANWCTAKEISLDYVGIEAFPLDEEMIKQTGYATYIADDLWRAYITQYKSSQSGKVNLSQFINLHVPPLQLMDFQSDQQFDVIYFDAFASANQPEMWNEEAIKHTISFLKPGGVFVTYAITGNLKRTLKSLGCKIEKVPGAAGKREMLRAVKLDLSIEI